MPLAVRPDPPSATFRPVKSSTRSSSVTVNGAQVSIDDLLSGPLGSVASGFLGARSFCIAQYLPSAIALDDVTVTDDDLVLDFAGRNVALGGSGLTAKGTCG